ncbi:MAG: flagellar biosynthesis anti-sigma factor FlgM [Pseudomonadota bacterium]
MKIGSFDPHSKPVAPSGNGNAQAAASAKAGSGAQPEASAKVALSPAAAVLVNEANADFDAAKVARIAQAIRDGKFEVNAEAIADRLIANTKELLAGPQH